MQTGSLAVHSRRSSAWADRNLRLLTPPQVWQSLLCWSNWRPLHGTEGLFPGGERSSWTERDPRGGWAVRRADCSALSLMCRAPAPGSHLCWNTWRRTHDATQVFPPERRELEDLQLRASFTNDGDREAFLAHPDAIELPLEQIAAGGVFVFERNGTIIGFAALLPRADGETELDALFVDPGMRRCGIGRSLVDHCAQVARAHGSAALCVVGNPHASDFHTACGFSVAGRTETRFGIGLLMRKIVWPSPIRKRDNRANLRAYPQTTAAVKAQWLGSGWIDIAVAVGTVDSKACSARVNCGIVRRRC